MSNVTPIHSKAKPLTSLTPRELVLWDALVSDWPANHFKSSDVPMMAEYVRALSMAEELGNQIPQTGDMVELKAVLDLRDREARRAAALSRTLRIAPQSRSDRHATETASRKVSGKRPWEPETN